MKTAVDAGFGSKTARLLNLLEQHHYKKKIETVPQDIVTLPPEGLLPEIREIKELKPFELRGNDVIVTHKINTGETVQSKISIDKFVMGINSAVLFLNMHLPQLFETLGAP